MIHSLVTEETATVYWDKPTAAPESYQIYYNGLQIGSTTKTHYTLNGLQSDTEYRKGWTLPFGER